MASFSDETDFSDLEKDIVLEEFMVKEKNCISVPNMLAKLGGYQSAYRFISDTPMAEMLYQKARDDIENLAFYQEIHYTKKHISVISEAILSVVRYKRGDVSRPRLTTVAALKIKPFFGMQSDLANLTFVRFFDLPCKCL